MLPLVEHQEAIAGALDLGEDVRGEQDGVLAAQAPDELAHLHDLHRVETVDGLVQDQERRPVDDRLGDADPLLVAVREGADGLVRHVAEGRGLDDLGQPLLDLGLAHAAELAGEAQETIDPHLGVERWVVRQVADQLPDLVRLGLGVEAADGDATRGRQEQAAQKPERGALAGAVQPEEADALALLDLEVQVADGGVLAVILGDAVDDDHLLAAPLCWPGPYSGKAE